MRKFLVYSVSHFRLAREATKTEQRQWQQRRMGALRKIKSFLVSNFFFLFSPPSFSLASAPPRVPVPYTLTFPFSGFFCFVFICFCCFSWRILYALTVVDWVDVIIAWKVENISCISIAKTENSPFYSFRCPVISLSGGRAEGTESRQSARHRRIPSAARRRRRGRRRRRRSEIELCCLFFFLCRSFHSYRLFWYGLATASKTIEKYRCYDISFGSCPAPARDNWSRRENENDIALFSLNLIGDFAFNNRDFRFYFLHRRPSFTISFHIFIRFNLFVRRPRCVPRFSLISLSLSPFVGAQRALGIALRSNFDKRLDGGAEPKSKAHHFTIARNNGSIAHFNEIRGKQCRWHIPALHGSALVSPPAFQFYGIETER